MKYVVALSILFSISSCSNIKPEISISSLMSSALTISSPSPFGLENYGDSFRFAGDCSRSGKKFQYQLDDLGWLDLPTTKPVANVGNFEYLSFADVYDIDCSDGKFDFYVFFSQMGAAYAANSVALPSASNPYYPESLPYIYNGNANISFIPEKIRIRILDSAMKELGESILTMPKAKKIRIIDNSSGVPFAVVSGFSKTFRLEVTDDFGKHSNLYENRIFEVNAKDSNSRRFKIYKSDCSSVFDANLNQIILPKYKSDVDFCVVYANSISTVEGPNSLINIGTGVDFEVRDMGASPLAPFNQLMQIKNSYDIYAMAPVQHHRVVKGLNYHFPINYMFYGGSSAGLSNYGGALNLLDGLTTTNVSLANGVYNSFSSISVYSSQIITNTASSNLGAIQFSAITDMDGFNFSYSHVSGPFFDGISNIIVPVDKSGNSTYAGPSIYNYRAQGDPAFKMGVSKSSCLELPIILANSNGTPLPSAAITVYLSADSGGFFYSDPIDCKNDYSPNRISSTTFTITGSATRPVYYRSPASVPVLGYDNVTLIDGPKVFTQKIFIKGN